MVVKWNVKHIFLCQKYFSNIASIFYVLYVVWVNSNTQLRNCTQSDKKFCLLI